MDRDLTFWLVFGAVNAFNLFALWSVRWPPMQDLGGWIELMDIMARYDDPHTIYASTYLLPTHFDPNSLVIYFGDLTSPFLDRLTAAKLLVTWYAVGTPLSILAVCRAFGRSRWLAAFAAPMVFNSLFNVGLLSFLVGIPLIFFPMALARSYAERGGWWRGLLLALTLVAAYSAHLFAFLVAFAISLAMLVLNLERLRRMYRFWALLPCLPFVFGWYVRKYVDAETTEAGRTLGGDGFGFVFESLEQRFTQIHEWGLRLFKDDVDEWMALALILCWLALMALSRGRRQREQTSPQGFFAGLGRYSLELTTGCCLVAFFFLPSHAREIQLIAERVLMLTAWLLVAWPRLDITRRSHALWMAIVVAVAAVYPFFVQDRFRQFEDELVGGMPEAVASLPERTRLAYIKWERRNPITHMGPLWHIEKAVHAMENGGGTDDSFAKRPHCAIQYREGQTPPSLPWVFWESRDLFFYDYVLLRTTERPTEALHQASLRLWWQEGIWWLFQVVREQPTDEVADIEADLAFVEEERAECPADQAMTGLIGQYEADRVITARPYCTALDEDTTEPRPSEHQLGVEQPWSPTFSLFCGPNEVLVGLTDNEDVTMESLGIVCVPRHEVVGLGPRATGPPSPDADARFTASCAAGEVAVGLQALAGPAIRSVGLLCESLPVD